MPQHTVLCSVSTLMALCCISWPEFQALLLLSHTRRRRERLSLVASNFSASSILINYPLQKAQGPANVMAAGLTRTNLPSYICTKSQTPLTEFYRPYPMTLPLIISFIYCENACFTILTLPTQINFKLRFF